MWTDLSVALRGIRRRPGYAMAVVAACWPLAWGAGHSRVHHHGQGSPARPPPRRLGPDGGSGHHLPGTGMADRCVRPSAPGRVFPPELSRLGTGRHVAGPDGRSRGPEYHDAGPGRRPGAGGGQRRDVGPLRHPERPPRPGTHISGGRVPGRRPPGRHGDPTTPGRIGTAAIRRSWVGWRTMEAWRSWACCLRASSSRKPSRPRPSSGCPSGPTRSDTPTGAAEA